jgi:hypothetical protein
LNEEDSSSLDAPKEFKTRNSLRNARLDPNHDKKIALAVRLGPQKPQEKGKVKFKKLAGLVVTTKAFESVLRGGNVRPSTAYNIEDWVEETCAGVKMWVNKQTGDVRTEQPNFDPPPQQPQQQQSRGKRFSSPDLGAAKKAIAQVQLPAVQVPTNRRNSSALFNNSFFQRTANSSTNSPDRSGMSSAGFIGSSSPSHKIRRTRSKSLDHEVGMGTACSLYDSEPMEELFLLLDKFSDNNKPKPTANILSPNRRNSNGNNNLSNLSPLRSANGKRNSLTNNNYSPLRRRSQEQQQPLTETTTESINRRGSLAVIGEESQSSSNNNHNVVPAVKGRRPRIVEPV